MNFLKRLTFLFILTFCLLFATISTSAEKSDSLSFDNLSNFNVFCVLAEYIDDPIRLDGQFSLSEYKKLNKMTLQKALSLTDSGAEQKVDPQSVFREELLSSVQQQVSLTCDGQCFYISSEIQVPSFESMCTIDHPLYGKGYTVSVDLSLSASIFNPFASYGNLRNTYFFSAETFQCVGVFGTRDLIRSGSRELVGRISSSSPSSEKAFCTSDGTTWNAAYYLAQACAKMQLCESVKFVFEARIPVEEVLLTLPENMRQDYLRAIRAKDERVCGLIDIKTSVCDGVSFSNGKIDNAYLTFCLYGNETCPISSAAKTWAEAYANSISFSDVSSTQSIARPFTFGSVTKENLNKTPIDSNISIPSDEGSVTQEPLEPPGDLNSDSANVATSGAASDDGPNDNAADDSAKLESFDALPDNPDFLPDETEIVYLNSTKNNEENTSDPVGSALLIVCGVLLMIAVFVVAMIFRSLERMENKSEKH